MRIGTIGAAFGHLQPVRKYRSMLDKILLKLIALLRQQGQLSSAIHGFDQGEQAAVAPKGLPVVGKLGVLRSRRGLVAQLLFPLRCTGGFDLRLSRTHCCGRWLC